MCVREIGLLLLAKAIRNAAYGLVLVGWAPYLVSLGLRPSAIGLTFAIALASGGAAGIVGGRLAGRWGHRTVLVSSAVWMALAGGFLALARGQAPILLAALSGVLSPTGQEVGPFTALEQAALSGLVPIADQARAYAWYNLVGSLATATGALLAGLAPHLAQLFGWPERHAADLLILCYSVAGWLLLPVYLGLGARSGALPPVVARPIPPRRKSPVQSLICRLTVLFGIDAFAGGLVVQGLVAYWFHLRFGVGIALLGPIFFGANLLSALSYLGAARIARRFGLLPTMVFTHLPSNLLLMLMPWMPTWPLAAGVLFLRHALSQMDVPTRQAYTMAVVPPEERSNAAGWTNGIRPFAAAAGPSLTGALFAAAASGVPFLVAGGLKAAYDLLLYASFRNVSA